MKKILLAGLFVVALQSVSRAADVPSPEQAQSAWLAFSNARGESSLILGDVNHPSANGIFRAIPDVTSASLDNEKLQLGFDLFRERRLSRDGSIACASCHIDMLGGVDRRPVPFGIGGAMGTLNAPTVFNAALNFRQFWDGRALTLEEQALGPIENPAEFGHDLDSVVAVLQGIPDYANRFDELYPDGITAANLGNAIAYYETMNFTGLTSPFLRSFEQGGEPLSRQAERGKKRFVEVGCASCHNGINLGGNSYQALGVAEPWYGNEREAREADDGLFARTRRERDRHVFKVPTLHNVAITGPWLHDGSITSLQQAVDQMARHQSGRYLANEDIDDIVAFLRTLSDRQGLIGDCAASGNYGVTMDCSMKKRSAEPGQGFASRVEIPGAEALLQLHKEEYAVALERVAAGPDRIEAEMQRIRSGQVAHYDFLQYEHIEMLRHARALSFPPASLEPGDREEMLTEAGHWQALAEDFELVIADFLRNQAVANSARANYLDLLRILSVEADEKDLNLLSNAEQSMLAFYRQPGIETRLTLENSTRALQLSNLNTQRLEELQIQLSLLIEVALPPQA